MACPQCVGVERQFDSSVARRELRRYRKRGPSSSTRLLLNGLDRLGLEAPTFLDVGGGVGAIQHELMTKGAAGGTHVDASPAYLEVSRAEAQTGGYADRISYIEGDMTELDGQVETADVVTLDRVLCCYHDMPALVKASAKRARRALGLVYPRQNALTRFGVRLVNVVMRLRRSPFRVFLHPTAAIEAEVAAVGMRVTSSSSTFLWHVTVFTREPGSA